jgi:AGZA family xanthine/uracil permease-like MFS transporter
MADFLERMFKLKENNTTAKTEIIAGLTTFMTMAYIIFVNPIILNFVGIEGLEGLGPGFAPTLAATCLAAGVLCIAMGLYSNYPFALASGMGLNAVVAWQLIVGMKLPWQAAMGVIFMEGVLITIFVLTGLREAVMNAIPISLKRAIGVGIGLFILFIGMVDGGLVKQGTGIPVTLGDLNNLAVFIAIIGILITAYLMAKRVVGSLLLGIILTTILAIIINYASGLTAFKTPGVAVIPKQILSIPDFSTFGAGLNFGVFSKIGFLTAILTIFSIMMSDFFDTMGTVIGIGGEGGFLKEGKLPRLNRVLLVDSLAAAFGGFSSASSVTTYIESASGVAEGGRTGLTSVVVGFLFLLGLFLAPIAGIIPPQATAPALILVGFYMCTIIKDIPFADFEEGFPALMVLVTMPFTYSITNGIGVGFVIYTFIKIVRGKAREVHWMMYLASAAFIVYFAIPLITSLLG